MTFPTDRSVMSSARSATQSWGRRFLRVPKDLDQRIRWQFLALALLVATLLLLEIAFNANMTSRVIGAAAVGFLAITWVRTYRRGDLTLFEDLLTFPLLWAVALTHEDPLQVLGVLSAAVFFFGLCFGMQYGSTRRAALRIAIYAGALLGATAVDAAVGGALGVEPFLKAIALVAGGVIMRTLASALRDNRLANQRLSSQAQLIDGLSESVIVCDERTRLSSWNPATERILGLTARDLEGTTLDEVLGPGFAPFGADLLGTHAPAKSLQRGPQLLEVAVISRRDTSGEPRGCVVIVREVTSKMAAERADRSARVAEDANRAKTEFLSRMSHELRTPLNAILGFAQLLEIDETDEDRLESVEQIVGGGRRLLSLIDDLVDVARIESGPQDLPLAVVQVDEMAERCLDLVGPLAAEHGVDLRFHASEPGCMVLANQRGIEQIVLNLLTNAIKYNVPNGWIDFTSEEAGPGLIRLSVADTGSGIAGDDLSRLFHPFERLGAEDSDIEGTGLGLILSQEIAKAMGSRIEVASSPEGSTFWLELQRVPEPREPQPTLSPVTAVPS